MSGFESPPPSRGAVAASAQDLSDAEFAALDALLAGIPEPLEPLDAVMLDGYLCGVIVQPRIVEVAEWLPYVYDARGLRWGEARPGPEQERARALILRRHAAINRSLAEHGVFEPYILIDLDAGDADPSGDASDAGDAEENDAGDASRTRAGSETALDPTQPWLDGFAQAIALFADLAAVDDARIDTLVERLSTGARQRDADARLDPPVPWTRQAIDAAIDAIVIDVAELYVLTEPLRYKVDVVRREAPKVGRNDPCPCGSGRKWKQCHGMPGSGDSASRSVTARPR